MEVFIKKLISLSFLFLAIQSGALFADHKLCIMVYPFENQGDAQYSWVSAGMTESVIADLGNISSVTVITDESRRQAVKEMEPRLLDLANPDTAVKVGQMTGANAIITGGYTVAAGRVRVVVNLVNVESGAVGKTIKLDGALDDIFSLQDRIVFSLMAEAANTQIRDVQKVAVAEKEKAAIEQKQTVKPEAYENYSKGLEKMGVDHNQALAYMQAALVIEPEYIAALVAAGNIYITLGHSDQAIASLGKALSILTAHGETNSLDYADVNRTLGNVFYNQGYFDSAEEYFLKARETLSRDQLENTVSYTLVLKWQASFYRQKNDYNTALNFSRNAIEILTGLGLYNTANCAGIIEDQGVIYREANNNDKALEILNQARVIFEKINFNNSYSYGVLMQDLGRTYTKLNMLQEAWDCLQKAREIYDRQRMQSTKQYALLLAAFALYYDKKDESANAGKYYRMAYDIYESIGYTGPYKEQARIDAERLGY